MKKIPLLIFLFAAACSSKNTSTATAITPAPAVTDTVAVSMEGMGDVKVDMTMEDLEKLLKRKFLPPGQPQPRPLDTAAFEARDSTRADAYFPDTINVRYKNVDYSIWLTREQQFDDSTYQTTVLQIISNSPLLKTTSGIRIGDDLQKIVSAYADSSQEITIGSRFDDPPANGKRPREVTIGGIVGPAITFFMANNKVESMRVSFNRHAE